MNNAKTSWDDGERIFTWKVCPNTGTDGILVARPAVEQPLPAALARLAHEFGLKDDLDGTWAVQPLELVREGRHMQLVLKDLGGTPLMLLLTAPMETQVCLRLHGCGQHRRGTE